MVFSGGYRLGYITGIIKSNELSKFKRSIFRMTRGKMISYQTAYTEELMQAIYDPNDEDSKDSLTAFLIIVPFMKDEPALPRKLSTLASVFHTKLMSISKTAGGVIDTIVDLETRLDEFRILKSKVTENVLEKMMKLASVNKVEQV